VPNIKVVSNIQIYLHEKFHIFMRSLSISSNLFSHLPQKSIRKGNSFWKILVGWFHRAGPKSVEPSGPVHCEDGPHPFPSPSSLPGGPRVSAGQTVRDSCLSRAQLSGSPPPNSLPCRTLDGIVAAIPTIASNHHLRHRATALPACLPESSRLA
jgi:hypothetical protein